MNNSDAYVVVILLAFLTWKVTSSLEPLPFPVLSFESEVGSDVIIQTGSGRFTYLHYRYSSVPIYVKCVCYSCHYNMDLKIEKNGFFFSHDQTVEDNIQMSIMPSGMGASGNYSCHLICSSDDKTISYTNKVTASLFAVSNTDKPLCATDKGNLILTNQFITLHCVAPQSPTTDCDLTWSADDDLLCTASAGDRQYVKNLCVFTHDRSANVSCGYTNCNPHTVWNEQCSLGGIKIVHVQELHIFPEQFSDLDTHQLTFHCESKPPLYPLQWYVFTDGGILTSDDVRHSQSGISIEVMSSYVYGNTTLTIRLGNDNRIKIHFVVCSTSIAEERRKLNAISRAASVEADPGSPLDEIPSFVSASTLSPSFAPTTAVRIENETSENSYQTELVVYPIIVAFLSCVVLCLLAFLIKAVFIPMMKSKRAKSVDESTPPLQDNPAYVSYNEDSSVPVNDSAYTEYTPDGTRPLPRAELPLNPING